MARKFDDVAERSAALTDAGSAILLRCSSAALARTIAEHPAVAAHCSQVGGRTLMVPDRKLKAFREAVRGIGYVVPVGVGS